MFNRKDTLLGEAIEAFNNNGAYSFVLNEYISKKKESGIDAEAVLSLVRKIELEEGSAVPLARMTACVKNRVNRSLILISLCESALCGSGAYLYVTRYVSDEMAEELKSKDVNFIDASGNAYIRAGDVYIFIKGNKQAKNPRERMTLLYTPIGLKVLFVLLSNPGIEKSPYRIISALAGVSLGAVSNIFSELKDAGYLYHSNSQLSNLVNKDRLFKKWVESYTDLLRPKLLYGRFAANNVEWWKNAALNYNIAQWGGEVAASILTEYLKPEIVTIYADIHEINAILLPNRLHKKVEGSIEILDRFWINQDNVINNSTVHPIIVYADLIASGHSRNIKTAEIIYEEHIKPKYNI